MSNSLRGKNINLENRQKLLIFIILIISINYFGFFNSFDDEISSSKIDPEILYRSTKSNGENNSNGTPPIIVLKVYRTSGPTHYPFSFWADESYDIDENDEVIKFDWDFGDGNTSTESNITHGYSNDGIYKILLKITDKSGLTSIDDNITIIVYNREPFVYMNCKTEGMVNIPIKMSATASDTDGNITGYYWEFGDGSFIDWSNESKATHEYKYSGTYCIRVTVKDDDGKTNKSSDVIVIKNGHYQQPSIKIIKTSTYAPTTVYLKLFVEDNKRIIVDYKWNFGDGNTSIKPNPIHTYQNSGVYFVNLYYKDNRGISEDTSIKIIVVSKSNEIKENEYKIIIQLGILVILIIIFIIILWIIVKKRKRILKTNNRILNYS